MQRKTPLKAKKPLRAKTTLKRKTALKVTNKPKKRVPLEKKTVRQLIKETDKYFSRYVRLRDSELEGLVWSGICITCSKSGPVAYIDDRQKLRFVTGWDNGHFVGRGNYVVRFNEENCNLQCSYRCNRLRSGEYVKYKEALRAKYGDHVPESLELLARQQPATSYKFTREELLGIIKDSRECINFYEREALSNGR